MSSFEDVSTRISREATLHSRPSFHSPAGNRFEMLLNVSEALCDWFVSTAAVWSAVILHQMLIPASHTHYPTKTIALAAVVAGTILVLLLDRDGAYRRGNGLLRIRETERVLRISTLATLLLIPFIYFSGHDVPFWIISLCFAIVPVSLTIAKQLFYLAVESMCARGIGTRNVVIYGAGDSGRKALSVLVRSPKLGLRPVAVIDDDPSLAGTELFELNYQRKRAVPVINERLTRSLFEHYDASLFLVAIPSLPPERFAEVVKTAHDAHVGVAFLPPRGPDPTQAVNFIDVDGLLFGLYGVTCPWTIYDPLKRFLDLLIAGAWLLLLTPFFALIALLIHLDSPGPTLFVQKRVGKHGRNFSIYKFRTMYLDAPRYASSPVNGRDPRITPIGRILRRSSLDELPQFLNVLRGDMSLVGPRPEMPFVVKQYSPSQMQRLDVIPGITGIWQLSADRAFPIHENIQYDLYYIRNRGIFMDLAILLHTLPFAMRGI